MIFFGFITFDVCLEKHSICDSKITLWQTLYLYKGGSLPIQSSDVTWFFNLRIIEFIFNQSICKQQKNLFPALSNKFLFALEIFQ